MPKCEKCGASIKYVFLKTNKTIPVNTGNLIPVLPGGKKSVCAVTLDGEIIIGEPVWKGTVGAVEGYVSHFSTCPYAKKGDNQDA